MSSLNLARRPFTNARPVVRVTVLLWVVGALLAVMNGALYWQALFGIEDHREQAAELAPQVAAEQARIVAARDALRQLELGQQNVRVAYLNERIAERTFPWSRLFDELAEVLPLRVRLLSLAPQLSDPRQLRGRRRGPEVAANSGPRRVTLQIRGAAESDESLLEMLDNLFASPWFERPSLPRESRQSDRSIEFVLAVGYLPDRPWVVEPALVEGSTEGPGAVAGRAAGGSDEEPWSIVGEEPADVAAGTTPGGARRSPAWQQRAGTGSGSDVVPPGAQGAPGGGGAADRAAAIQERVRSRRPGAGGPAAADGEGGSTTRGNRRAPAPLAQAPEPLLPTASATRVPQ